MASVQSCLGPSIRLKQARLKPLLYLRFYHACSWIGNTMAKPLLAAVDMTTCKIPPRRIHGPSVSLNRPATERQALVPRVQEQTASEVIRNPLHLVI